MAAGDTMSFLINDANTGGGNPRVRVTVTENPNGTLTFEITQEVGPSGGYIGDLRGFFIDFPDGNEPLDGLKATNQVQNFGSNSSATQSNTAVVGNDTVTSASTDKKANDANLNGLSTGGGGFDFGLEIGSQGIGKDDVRSFKFTLDATADLKLTDLTNASFGVRLTSVGAVDANGSFTGARDGSSKIGETAAAVAGDQVKVVLDDDDLANGNANGVGDDSPANTDGFLAHNYGGPSGTTLLTDSGLTLPPGFSAVLSDGGKTLTIKQGSVAVLEVKLSDSTSGHYTVTELAPIKHAAGNDENNICFTIKYVVSSSDGDTATGSMSINVDDDTPTVGTSTTARVDEDDLSSGNNDKAAGDDIDPNSPASATGSVGINFGADGAGKIGNLALTSPVTSHGHAVTLEYDSGAGVWYGKADGHNVFSVSFNLATAQYTFTLLDSLDHPAADTEDNLGLTFTFDAEDGDGDKVSGGFAVNVDDDSPTAGKSSVILDDEGLSGGITGNGSSSGDVDGQVIVASGTLGYHAGADGLKSLVLTGPNMLGAETVTTSWNAATHTLTVSSDRGAILTVHITDLETGAYDVTLLKPVIHADGDGENDATYAVGYTITDGDGDTATGGLTITVNDDTPTADSSAVATLDDEGLPGGIAGSGSSSGDVDGQVTFATGTLGYHAGADGLKSLVLNGPTTLGAETVTTSWNATTHTLTVSSDRGDILTVHVTNLDTGAYEVTLLKPVIHTDGAGENDATYDVGYTITDGDGDTATGGLTIKVNDDTPIARDDASSVVEDSGIPVTGNVFGTTGKQPTDTADSIGADGAASTGPVTGVHTGDESAAGNAGTVGTALQGAYGRLTLHADGTYSYALDNANTTVNALNDNQTLTDKFTYTITDGDGDTDQATLTITINGHTDPTGGGGNGGGGNPPAKATALSHGYWSNNSFANSEGFAPNVGEKTFDAFFGLDSPTLHSWTDATGGNNPTTLSSADLTFLQAVNFGNGGGNSGDVMSPSIAGNYQDLVREAATAVLNYYDADYSQSFIDWYIYERNLHDNDANANNNPTDAAGVLADLKAQVDATLSGDVGAYSVELLSQILHATHD